MNIVIFSPTWPLHGSANGVTSYSTHMASGLREAGHQVKIVTAELTDPSLDEAYELSYRPNLVIRAYLSFVDRLFSGYKQYFLSSRSIILALKKINKTMSIDVFEIEESFGWHHHLQKKLSFPIILRLHGPHFISCENRLTSLIDNFDSRKIQREARAIGRAKYITAPSQWVLNTVQEKYKITAHICQVIPNPIEEIAAEACWRPSSFNSQQILFVGRFDSTKGADVLLNAFAQILRDFPSATLHFAGPDKGIHRAGKKLYFDDYLNEIFTDQEKRNIKFYGLVGPKTISKLRKQSHLTVVASRHEVFGYTALEALAHGSPLIASKVGGLTEVVIDNESGLLFETENASDLSQKIIRLLKDEKTMKLVSQNGHSRCVSQYSNKRIAVNVAEFYQAVISDHHSQNHAKDE